MNTTAAKLCASIVPIVFLQVLVDLESLPWYVVVFRVSIGRLNVVCQVF